MHGKDTTNTTFSQLFEPVFHSFFRRRLKVLEVDKYVKKLTTLKFVILMAFAQFQQLSSLREISNLFHNENFKGEMALCSISFSQLSRRLRTVPLEIIKDLFGEMVRQVGIEKGFKHLQQNIGRLHLIDSTTISLSLTRYRWADFRKTKAGIKIHLRLRVFEKGMLPDAAIITPASRHDRTQMDELVVEEEDALNVFDRGYVDYDKFDRYCENGIRFVTRLKSNALAEVLEERPVFPGSQVKKDSIVRLGTKGLNQMEHPLRRLEAEDTEGNQVIILTNDFYLSADELSDIYRCRWQIELFFKWLKQHLEVKHFYGQSEQAVENQIYLALIMFCLMLLVQLKTDFKGNLLVMKRLLDTCLFEPFFSFVEKLRRPPQRASRGRPRVDHEKVFQFTLRQVIEDEADHLDDLSYDPLFL